MMNRCRKSWMNIKMIWSARKMSIAKSLPNNKLPISMDLRPQMKFLALSLTAMSLD